MGTLTDKRILLGITGGIAAYKCIELTRRLKDAGASVQIVLSESATAFVTPMTLQAVSGNPVRTSLLDTEAEAGMGHIELARWADLIVIAPATANTLAKIAHGFADDLLSTLCLATKSPIALAPAMNQQMWLNPVTQRNIVTLCQLPHIQLWGPAEGAQACGEVGPGRLLEPAELLSRIEQHFQANSSEQQTLLAGRHVVITAGPTREAIDPVRYLSNESSGKMGYALAEAFVQLGARVTLVSGPTNLDAPANVTRIDVTSAMQMFEACIAKAKDADIVIGAAAVADFRPANISAQKIKKGRDDSMQLTLIKNPDIIAEVAKLTPKPWVVGFAAETEQLETYAKGKLERKGLDMVIANDVSRSDIGFNSEDNAVTIFTRLHNGEIQPLALPKQNKHALAQTLARTVAEHFGATYLN